MPESKPHNSNHRARYHAADDAGSRMRLPVSSVLIGVECAKKHYHGGCCQHHWIFLGGVHETFPSAMNRSVNPVLWRQPRRQLRRQGNPFSHFAWTPQFNQLLAMRTVDLLSESVTWKLNGIVTVRALCPAIINGGCHKMGNKIGRKQCGQTLNLMTIKNVFSNLVNFYC